MCLLRWGSALRKRAVRSESVLGRRLRSRKRPASNQNSETDAADTEMPGRPSPKITSELEAPRNGRAPRPEDPTTEQVTVTKDQLANMLFHVDSLLTGGGSVEEIRLQLVKETTHFFNKGVDNR